jgi:hypothetical protein
MTPNLAPSPLPRPTSPRANLVDLAPSPPLYRGRGPTLPGRILTSPLVPAETTHRCLRGDG